MKFNLYYDIVALFFALFLLMNHILAYSRKTDSGRLYRKMAVLNVIVILLDIITSMNRQNYGHLPVFFSMLLSTLYYAACNLLFFSACRYFSAVIENRGGKIRTQGIAKAVFCCQMVLLTANQFLGFYFRYDAFGRTNGIFFYGGIGINILYLVLVLLNMKQNPDCFARRTPVLSFSFLTLFITILLYLLSEAPGIVLGGFGITLGLFAVMCTLERRNSENQVVVLADYNERLEAMVKERTRQTDEIQSSIIRGIADAIAEKEYRSAGHASRTAAIAALMADKMKGAGLPHADRQLCSNIARVAPLYNIGEISISSDILRKEGTLTGDEAAKYQTHTVAGAEVIGHIFADCRDRELVNTAENMARCHHECFDGSGYPQRLKGEEIPLEARVIAIAEAFDLHMDAHSEIKRNAVAVAMKQIWDETGKLFDPALIRFLFASRDEICALYEDKSAEPERKEAEN